MSKKDNRVQTILASAKLPLLAHYNAEKGFNPIIVSRLVCAECNTEIVANKTAYPLCPCCPSVMAEKQDAQAQTLDNKDFSDLHALASCKECGTNYISNSETVASLGDLSFNCLVCSDPVKVSDDDADTTKTSSTDDSDKSATDTGDNKTDTEAEKELNETLKKMGLVDEDGKSVDKTDDKSDKTDDKSTVTSGDDDTDPEEESDDTEATNPDDDDSSDDDDDDSEATASLAVFKAALKKGKKFSLIASDGFENWYLFVDKSPLAIASITDADATVQRIFRSRDYVTAFEQAIKTDGKISKKLTEDFGFEPIKVDVKLDDVADQMVNDKIEEKTKDLDEKIKSLSGLFDQCVGISSLGIAKGMYPKGDGFRNSLVAKLTNLKVRDPEEMVDAFLGKELPILMRDVLVQAQDLMSKNSTESLETLASTVKDMAPRAIVKTKTSNVVPLMVTSEAASFAENTDHGNFNKEAKKSPAKSLAFGLKPRC